MTFAVHRDPHVDVVFAHHLGQHVVELVAADLIHHLPPALRLLRLGDLGDEQEGDDQEGPGFRLHGIEGWCEVDAAK